MDNKKRPQKLTAAFLVCSLLCSLLLSSCGLITIRDHRHGSDTEDTTELPPLIDPVDPVTTPSHTVVDPPEYLGTAQAYLDQTTERDFKGIQVFVATIASQTITPTENSFYNAAIEKRNSMVQKKHNAAILTLISDEASLIDSLTVSEAAGDPYSDLLLLPAPTLGTLELKGLLLNMQSLPYTDYEAPYFNAQALSQMTAGSMTFAVSGAASESLESRFAVFFNKDMAASLGLPSLYASVYSGNFTWDVFLAYARDAVSAGYQGYGSTLGEADTATLALLASGQTYMQGEFGSLPTRSFNTQVTEQLLPVLKTLLVDKDAASVFSSGAMTQFRKGGMLFCLAPLSEMKNMTKTSCAWGILPLPKVSEEQPSYYSQTGKSELYFAAPRSTSNVDNTGIMLQSINAASYGHVQQAFYDAMTLMVICDTDTLSMLDRIRDSSLVDFTGFFASNTAVSSATKNLILSAASGKDTIASLYNTTEKNLFDFLSRYFR